MNKRIGRAVLAVMTWSAVAVAAPFQVAPGAHGSVKFVVEGPIDDVPGETRSVSGSIDFDAQKWADTLGVISVRLNTIRTGINERDEDMRTEFLEVSRFPFAVLELQKIERPSSGALVVGANVDGEAVASFELHGIRRFTRFPLNLRLENDGLLWARGRFEVPLSDFNIQRPQRLFLKLGEVATVSFDVAFAPSLPSAAPVPVSAVEKGEPAAPLAPTVATVLPAGPKVAPRPARKPKPQLQVTYLFTGDDAKAKGERLFHSTDTGGAGNKLTCYHCHAKADERLGLLQKDGFIRSSSSMFNASQRPTYWNGFAPSLGKAANICQKMFMKGTGLSEQQQGEIQAFAAALSADAAPALDPKVLFTTYETSIRTPTAGDAERGKKLADQFCMTCHLDGRVGPVWQLGLYEPEWVVARVRHLERHSAKIMPPFSITRLPDTDLRDIVTYLTGSKAGGPIFDRKKRASADSASK